MNTSSASRADALALFAGIVAIAALAWLSSAQFSSIEVLVSHDLFDQFSKPDGASSASQALSIGTEFLRLGITCGFAAFATIAAYRVSRQSRLIVLLQLLALNMVLHTIFASQEIELAMPISMTLAIVLGIGYGSLERRAKELRQQLEAREVMMERLTEELRDSNLQIIKDDEIDRRLLAGDLHDQVLNDLKLLRETVNKLPGTEIESEKSKIDQLVVRSMQQIREVMDSLSPTVLQHLGIVDAIEDCVRSGADRAGYKVRFRCHVDHAEFSRFGEVEQSLLYRLVQESVTNVCKHAEASTVKCTITAHGDKLVISILDDGKGMKRTEEGALKSRGLKYMQQRASIIGADIRWLPGDDGKGTRVDITIDKSK